MPSLQKYHELIFRVTLLTIYDQYNCLVFPPVAYLLVLVPRSIDELAKSNFNAGKTLPALPLFLVSDRLTRTLVSVDGFSPHIFQAVSDPDGPC